MIKIEKIDVWGVEHAIRGMRNPMNSWNKSDSYAINEPVEYNDGHVTTETMYVLGKSDLDLMRKLYKAGTEHRKYLRQIMVSMDITAPLYWWKEMDTYKVGVTRNSCSTMHKIHAKAFTLDDFSHEHLGSAGLMTLESVMERLNQARNYFVGEYDNVQPDVDKKSYWWEMIQLLPSSYNQKATITCNYENIVNMLRHRSEHKLDEWREFCEIMRSDLPYLSEIIADD